MNSSLLRETPNSHLLDIQLVILASIAVLELKVLELYAECAARVDGHQVPDGILAVVVVGWVVGRPDRAGVVRGVTCAQCVWRNGLVLSTQLKGKAQSIVM